MTLYLDTSALVKLVVEEAETRALRTYLAASRDQRAASSALVRTELRRAVLRFAAREDVRDEEAREAAQEATRLLRSLDLVRVGGALLDRAGEQQPPSLRSLDAVHLQAAKAFGTHLHALVAYDRRLLDAGCDAGMPTVSPGIAEML